MTTYDIGYENPDTGQLNPPIEQGSTFRLPFTVNNIFANGGVGCTIRGQLRTTYDATAKTDFTAAITTTTAELLTCLASLSATTTAGMAAGTYVYDIEIEDTTGFVLKPLRGRAIVLPEVTK